jgi:glycerate-2-kinase
LLTQAILPGQVINLTVSDVVGDPFDYITGPTVADTSCVADAVDVLKAYGLWDRVAPSVRRHLSQGQDAETPKAFDPNLVHSFLLVPSAAACNAASSKAQSLGFEPLVLTTSLEGESQEAGIVLGSIAREILRTGRPLPPPCAVVASGEVTVTVLDAQGTGGPSQELALGAAMAIEGLPGVVVASMDTDGFDGPTEFAGALADGTTMARTRRMQRDLFRELRAHNVTPLLKDLKDGLLTGPTGTNIADLVVMLIAEDKGPEPGHGKVSDLTGEEGA